MGWVGRVHCLGKSPKKVLYNSWGILWRWSSDGIVFLVNLSLGQRPCVLLDPGTGILGVLTRETEPNTTLLQNSVRHIWFQFSILLDFQYDLWFDFQHDLANAKLGWTFHGLLPSSPTWSVVGKWEEQISPLPHILLKNALLWKFTNFGNYLNKVFVSWPIWEWNTCCTCILVQQTRQIHSGEKSTNNSSPKCQKRMKQTNNSRAIWERDLYEEMGQGGKFCFKTLHRGNKSRLHRLQQTLLMTSDQEMAFSKGAHYMSKCHLICQTIYMKPTHRNISWGRKFCRRQ